MQSRYFKRMYEKVMASFYFRSRFLCFKRPIKKIRINSKIPCPQSPSFLVPRPCRLRETKRAMGTRMDPFLLESGRWGGGGGGGGGGSGGYSLQKLHFLGMGGVVPLP